MSYDQRCKYYAPYCYITRNAKGKYRSTMQSKQPQAQENEFKPISLLSKHVQRIEISRKLKIEPSVAIAID